MNSGGKTGYKRKNLIQCEMALLVQVSIPGGVRLHKTQEMPELGCSRGREGQDAGVGSLWGGTGLSPCWEVTVQPVQEHRAGCDPLSQVCVASQRGSHVLCRDG